MQHVYARLRTCLQCQPCRIPPIMSPPTDPMIKIGANAFVTRASGKLKRKPNTSPTTQPGHGKTMQPITRPIAKRLRKAATKAVVLSVNCSGSMSATETAPKIKPLMIPPLGSDTGRIPTSHSISQIRMVKDERSDVRSTVEAVLSNFAE